MPVTPGDGEFWKMYKGQLKKSMDIIADHGVSVFSREELKQIANPIIREAKKRLRDLERAGLTDSPAYRYLARNEVKLTAAGKNLNAIKHNVKEASEFLKAKTSTVAGAREFLYKTINMWAGRETTVEEREKIWDTYHRLEQIHPGYFLKETYGSSELSADIYTISQTLDKSDWDIDVAMERLSPDIPDILQDDLERDATMRWSGWM